MRGIAASRSSELFFIDFYRSLKTNPRRLSQVLCSLRLRSIHQARLLTGIEVFISQIRMGFAQFLSLGGIGNCQLRVLIVFHMFTAPRLDKLGLLDLLLAVCKNNYNHMFHELLSFWIPCQDTHSA